MNKLLITAALCLAACTPKKQMVNNDTPDPTNVAQHESRFCPNGNFRFVGTDIDLKANAKTEHLPTKYEAFHAKPEDLKVFMMQIKTRQIREITVPLAGRCVTFMLRPSNVLNEELAKKYPDLQSYQGIGKSNNSETAQIDFDGEYIRVMAQLAEGEFVFDPFQLKQGHVYLSFNAKDSGVPKRPYQKR